MKTLIPLLIITLLTSATPTKAQETPKKLLSDALFAEEANQDLPTAIAKYQALLDQYDQNKKAAGHAIFRLAEINRKQGNQQKATTLYTRLLTEFPTLQPQANTAKKQLLALGQKLPTTRNNNPDPEATELARLKKLATTSPDILHKPETLDNAAKNGWLTVLQFLIDQNVPLDPGEALTNAADNGHSAACQLLLENGLNPQKGNHVWATYEAIKSENWKTLEVLLAHDCPVKSSGSSPQLTKHLLAVIKPEIPLAIVKMLVASGFDFNYTPKSASYYQGVKKKVVASLLHQAAYYERNDLLDYLLSLKINPDIAGESDGITPLHFAAYKENVHAIQKLLHAGAEVNAVVEDSASLRGSAFSSFIDKTPISLAYHPDAFSEKISEHRAVKLLINSGARIPRNLLSRASLTGDLELIKILVEKGALINDPDEKKSTPLLHALVRSNIETAKFLIQSGAIIAPETLIAAPVSIRESWARSNLYPKLQKQTSISLSIPAVNWHTELLSDSSSKSELAIALLYTPIPYLIQKGDDSSSYSNLFLSPTIKWQILREGTQIAFKPSSLPDLKPGDIIEISNFIGADLKPEIYKRDPNYSPRVNNLNNREDILAMTLREQVKFPITIKHPNFEKTYFVDGSISTFDPRKNIIPLKTLGKTLDFLGFREGFDRSFVNVTRKNGKLFKLESKQLNTFILAPNDQIILQHAPYPPDSVAITNKERNFHIYIQGDQPTFLQALTHVTAGFDSLSTDPPYFDSSTPGHLRKARPTSPEILAFQLQVRQVSLIALPNIDLKKIKVISGGKERSIDLDKFIEDWDGTEKSAKSIDFTLDKRTILEISQLKGEVMPLSEKQQTFFKTAITYRLRSISKDGQIGSVIVQHTPPRWVKTSTGLVPVQMPNTRNSMQGGYNNGMLDSNRKEFSWPKNGYYLSARSY